MTEEELKKKAEEYTEKNTRGISLSIYAIKSIYKAYIDGYEQGQHNEFIKQYLNTKIAEVEKENEELKNQLLSNTEQLKK